MRFDIDKILREIETLPAWETEIGLQGVEGNMDPFLSKGTAENGRYEEGEYKNHEYTKPIFDIPYVNSIMQDLDLCRTRLMILKPKTCYYWHADQQKRCHIPLKTNESCFLIIEKKIIHLPADGHRYVLDTTKEHTALNAGHTDRLHIVGVTKNDS